MNLLDWIILIGTLITIVGYGVWKTRGSKNIEGYLLGDKNMKWWTIGLSIMATQASAITFLSTPGQAYDDGMRFIQFYFGLPIAMVVVSFTFVPIFHKLKVFTAYEYLESRFDLKTRIL
ncbi:MAG: sodium:solute symporter, partial [Cyclobacteriaceae bacterium]|nr:sodium:solute symporter [Cyclobacteriaceae bacterium]